jgi:hypothetical protein
MKWRKINLAVYLSSLMFLEYGVSMAYAIKPFPNSVDSEKYPNIQLLCYYFLIHAVVCLVAAIITGFIIHKKTTVDALEIFLWSCFCAVISLPATLLLMFAAFTLSTIMPNQLAETSLYEIVSNIMLIVSYILGIILSSALSIRMAMIDQNGSGKKLLR